MATATKREDAALARVDDVCADQAVREVVELDAAVPTVAPASLEPTPIVSKRAAKKAKKAKSVDDDGAVGESTETKDGAGTLDHPYLSFLYKRIRLYKKKLEKIRALEAACVNEGKVLNDQQQEVVGNKPVVEKMIAEFESLREQFVEVYKKEEKDKKMLENAKKEERIEPQAIAEPTEEKEDGVPMVAKEETMVSRSETPELPRDAFAYVEDLLRTLHAVTLHQALGKEVPPVLDYFSKVVLGTTRPPAEVPFDVNLAESLEEATRYLTKSEKIVAQAYTYMDLRAMVEKLGVPTNTLTAEDSVGSDDTDDEHAVATAAIVHPPAAEELPNINFFTESQLQAEDDEVDVVTEDKDNQHETLPEAIEPTISEEETPEDSQNDEEAPVAAPPKSFTATTTDTSTSKNVWVRKTKSTEPVQNDSSDEKNNQRRRFHGRSKSNNNSNSPRNGNVKRREGSDGVEGESNGNSNQPRRPRPQKRLNDENSGSFNANRANKAGGKADERRPRSERALRKQQPTQPQQYREAAQV